MIINTHAVAGAAIVALFPSSPALVFTLALASHYALDVLPHWDYHLKSDYKLKGFLALKNKDKITDSLKIGIDVFLAVAIPTLLSFFLNISWWYIAIGAIFGVLPDALAFVINEEPWNVVNRFHAKFHAKERINDKVSFISQGIAVICIVIIVLGIAKR